LQQERLLVAILANTMAAFAFDWTMETLRKQTTSHGVGKLPQVTRFALVEMSTEIKLGRTFLEKMIADHMEGLDIISETSMAKFWNTEMANRVVSGCLDICAK
jgi:acyl-CoA dehydrogenase